MDCRQCATELSRPGDYCLTCRSANTDVVVLDLARDRATVTCLLDDEVVAEREITTRPEEVYAAGDRDVVTALRGQIHYPLYRVADDDPVAAVRERRGDAPLEVVEAPVAEKLGGRHSTLIGGRDGQRAIEAVAGHPHVKKVVPGPIDGGGSGSRSGVRAKATRADENGNVRLLVRSGSSVQENRVVTTAGERNLGEHVREDLNDALREADLQDE